MNKRIIVRFHDSVSRSLLALCVSAEAQQATQSPAAVGYLLG